jgi:CheY-like chemotaxis protein
MAKLIIADENEGRRSLLANTLEREGFNVTRGSTLRQTEATALATMPEIVIIDAEWSTGSALDSAQRLVSDPEFAFKCRIVILSRDNSKEFLISAAKAGVSEVLKKPLDMKVLIEQLWKHGKKQFVPPPAEIADAGNTDGTFSLSIGAGETGFALPMLQNLLGPETITAEFVNSLFGSLEEKSIDISEGIDQADMAELLKLALEKLLVDGEFSEEEAGQEEDSEEEDSQEEESQEEESQEEESEEGDGEEESPEEVVSEEKEEITYKSLSSSKKLGGGDTSSKPTLSKQGIGLSRGSSMERILQGQADKIARDVERNMDILDEMPEIVTFAKDDDHISVDPEVLRMTLLAIEYTNDLLWSLGRPAALNDITLLTQIENAAEMMADILKSLPEVPPLAMNDEPVEEDSIADDENSNSTGDEDEDAEQIAESAAEGESALTDNGVSSDVHADSTDAGEGGQS